jgi:RNA polymerase sigma-70 factor (sigma-E family)
MRQEEDCVDDQLAEFVRGRYSYLLRRAYLLTGNHPAAEDLVQEALYRCCRVWRHSAVGNPGPYVDRVMVNLLVSKSRLRRYREEPTEVLPDRGVSDGSAERADRDAMWRALQLAPPRQRAILVLRFYEGLTETDIAECLGVSVGTVRSQTAKALVRLRNSGVDAMKADLQ